MIYAIDSPLYHSFLRNSGFIWDEEERQSVYLEKKNWKTPPI